MANGPIGISFLPSQENQSTGLKQGQMEGDLGEAFKILSLRLPRVVGARAPTPGGNLSGAGTSDLSGLSSGAEGSGFNPNAALFEALIKAMLQGGSQTLDNGAGQMFDSGTGLTPMDGSSATGASNILRPKIGFITQGEPAPGSFSPGGVDYIDESQSAGAMSQPRQRPSQFMDKLDTPSGNNFQY